MPCDLPADETRELWLVVSYRLATDTTWADAGHEVGFAQFKLRDAAPSAPFIADVSPTADSATLRDARSITWKGTDFALAYDTCLGALCSWRVGSRQLLERGPVLNFWRAPTANDGKEIGGRAQAEWRAHGLHDLKPRYGVPRLEMSRTKGPALVVPVRLGGPVVSCGIEAELR